ncbi:hypothetical protein AWB91_23060 [Mycobacterium paraense]|uniref:DUF4258 domain-containing protein n=1 Tax=Mycobacterium paraense TaxID=767916 RepID=A0ABX3VJ47_9MYCO|nr:hypothetical protein AWB91_23060 [Mycobacterium paraense]ORW35031.1 hypothetical protein AWB88_27275 [Mycobacterium paraense]
MLNSYYSVARWERHRKVPHFHRCSVTTSPETAIHDEPTANPFVEDADDNQVWDGVVLLMNRKYGERVHVVLYYDRHGLP